MYRTIAKKVFWEFDSIIMQNLPLFCTLTWRSHHVSENQELMSKNVRMGNNFKGGIGEFVARIETRM